MPFAADKKGTKLVTDFHVSRNFNFPFSFYLDLNFIENDPASRSRVQKLAGTVPINNGVAIPVRLRVSKIDQSGENPIFDKEILEEKLASWGSHSYSKIIAAINLPKGDYKIEIEALQDIPELEGVPIDFDIHIPGNLK